MAENEAFNAILAAALAAGRPEDTPLRRVLFNCCPGHVEPDWVLFDALEIHAIRDLFRGTDDGADGSTCFEVVTPGPDGTFAPDEEPHAWCVYAHYDAPLATGVGLEDITDCDTQALAEAVYTVLEARRKAVRHAAGLA